MKKRQQKRVDKKSFSLANDSIQNNQSAEISEIRTGLECSLREQSRGQSLKEKLI